jgi:hypothetical protein
MDLVVDGNTLTLIRTGNPPAEVLRQMEALLRIQYADAMGDQEYRLCVNVMRDITMIDVTLTQIESLINTLRNAYHPIFERELNDLLHSSFKFDVTRPDDYDKQLARAYRRSRGIFLRKMIKEGELQKLNLKYLNGAGAVTREYYYGILLTLSDDAGYPIHDDISTWQFCERVKRVNKRTDQANMKLKRPSK